jgi:hypothetical protein
MISVANVKNIGEEPQDSKLTENSINVRKCSSSTDGGPQEIHQSIPDGIEIKKAPYGHGVFATKFFPKGSTLYIGNQMVIPNEYAEFRLVIGNTGNIYHLNTETHSVQFSETERWLYLFDSFMNHSCDPTTISRQTEEQRSQNQYQTVALKDIYPGDEITCDYNLFEYDCHGKVIEVCLCGSVHCIGRVAGFRFLSKDEQKRRIDLVDDEVLESMTAEHLSNKFLYISDLACPTDRVRIEYVRGSTLRMVACRDFQKGENIFSNESLIFPEDYTIVINLFGHRKWLELLVHTVNVGKGMREFYYFDSFQNHSCDPTAEMVYTQDEPADVVEKLGGVKLLRIRYDMIALRSIQTGVEITSDYEGFDKGLDQGSFECHCGSSKCRGTIKA